jgi:polar amino acid transport system substrate-binding protein
MVKSHGRVLILIADIPAIHTYMALGYPENRARRDKAIPKGNLLKNKVIKAQGELGYLPDQVRIINWGEEVENNKLYQNYYKKINDLYLSNELFRIDADNTTRNVLTSSEKEIEDLEKAVKIAVHYLLSELAFLEWAPEFLSVKKIFYVYHKNWPVYENYIIGKYDKKDRPYLDFLLLENPWETFNPIWGLEEESDNLEGNHSLERIKETKIIRVGFSNYPPALMHDEKYNNFSGIFYEIMMAIAKKHKWQIKLTEETGYGAIIDGLNSNRFDVFGSTVWPTPERKEQAIFSKPLYLSPVYAWAKKNDKIKNISSAKIVVKENDISHSIAMADYPNARLIRVPQLTAPIELLSFVADNRGNVTFAEPYLVKIFNDNSNIKMVKIMDQPIREYENTFMFKSNNNDLRDLFDKEIEEMKNSGDLNKLIKKYTGTEDTFRSI